jgi:N-acetylneuraminate synthase
MDPAELRLLIDRSREIQIARNNKKQRTEQEESVYRFARGSLVADSDLVAGHEITENDIWARRPGTGEIGVEHFYQVVGRTLKVSVARNQQLKWSDFLE